MLKGKAIIEMYDKDTNELVYSQESDNIVTDAYKQLIQPNVALDIGFNNENRFNLSSVTPMIDKMFGGVFLMGRQRDPSVYNFMINKYDYNEKVFIGCAGGEYNGESIYRGTINKAESGYNEKTKEYTQVWDFPSNAANGKISSISLVPRYLGNQGLISEEKTNSLILPYGNDFEGEAINFVEDGVHLFHRAETSNFGYYLYSKDKYTNVYCKLVDKKYIFTEVTKRMTLGLRENFKNYSTSTLMTNTSDLYDYKTYEVDFTSDSSISSLPAARFMQCSGGLIYFVTHTNTKGNLKFNVYKINAETYERVEGFKEVTMNVEELTGKTIYPKIIFDNITFTSGDYLYILTLDGIFKSIKINNTSTSVEEFEVFKFYDTVLVTPYKYIYTGSNTIFILNGEDKLVKNNIDANPGRANCFLFNKINTNDDTLNYPLALVSSASDSMDYESLSVVTLPCLMTINNINEFTKNSSNVLKVRYILKEF